MIRIENISKTYQKGTQTVFALREVSLDIPAGSFYALVGRSGSGKSTLLQMIGDWIGPLAGTSASSFPKKKKTWPPCLGTILPSTAAGT